MPRGARRKRKCKPPRQTKTQPMFENLTDRLEKSFKMLKGEGQITELNVAETLKDIR